MTEDTNDLPVPDELESLKKRAELLGIAYHPNIGLDKLRNKVNNKLNANTPQPREEPAPISTAPKSTVTSITPTAANKERANKETIPQRNARLNREAAKLIRVRVTCMNPNKKDWEGEFITVSNSVVGTHKKYVPFNIQEGWHVPNIIYQALRERKCQIFVTEQGPQGHKQRKGKLINEFAIDVLTPLTPAQLKELAQQQAMAGSID